MLNSLAARLKSWRLHGCCPFCDDPLQVLAPSSPQWGHLKSQIPSVSPFSKGSALQHKSELIEGPSLLNLPVCQQCFSDLPWCDETGETLNERSAFYYSAPIREYILAGKGGNQPAKLQLLGKLMALRFTQQIVTASQNMPQAIIPVPLHKSRLRQRGFNQSIELIRPFARQHNIPLLRHAVYRNRDTGEQKGLTESMRKTNIANAFSIRKTLNYQHVAIFDDVITTGATCTALQTLLLAHGIKKVEIWCCATTKNDLTA